MEITISGKNMRVTKGIREHVQDKLSRMEKFSPRIVECHVVLKKEKYIYGTKITLYGKNIKTSGEGSQKDNVYASIDQAVDRIAKQLKKHRDKIKDHHKEHGEHAEAPKERIARKMLKGDTAEGGAPEIIEVPNHSSKPMSIQEASLQLQVGKEPFLVFSNAQTKRPNVIFKRKDGNHGLIDSEV